MHDLDEASQIQLRDVEADLDRITFQSTWGSLFLGFSDCKQRTHPQQLQYGQIVMLYQSLYPAGK